MSRAFGVRPWIGGVVLAALLMPLVAAAQTARSRTTPEPAGLPRIRIGANALLTAGTPETVVDAGLPRSDESSLTLFSTSNRIRAGFGLELHADLRITSRFAIEVAGSSIRTQLETTASEDFEEAASVIATAPLERYGVEAAGVWVVPVGQRVELFLRAGGGWLRESVQAGIIVADGSFASAGGGVCWWMRGARGHPRLGLEFGARAIVQRGGFEFTGSSQRVIPAATAGLVLGF